jgi:hypothetical protein
MIYVGITIAGFILLFIQERYWAFKNRHLQIDIQIQEAKHRDKQYQLDCFHYDITELILKLESIIEDIPEEEQDGAEGSAYGLCLQEVEHIRDRFI